MNDLNKVTLVGSVVSAPRRTELESILLVLEFVDEEGMTDRASVEFYGKLAEIVEKYVREEARVYVEGKLHNGSRVIAEQLIMLGMRHPGTRFAA